MNIYPVTQNDFHAAIRLLEKNNLPTSDIKDTTTLFALYDQDELAGTIGLEQDGEAGLLRSLCIDEAKRNTGAGKVMVDFIERIASAKGIKTLYLLTTTAAAFFAQKEYTRIDRKEVPGSIRNMSEFASVCPASATIMKKALVSAGG